MEDDAIEVGDGLVDMDRCCSGGGMSVSSDRTMGRMGIGRRRAVPGEAFREHGMYQDIVVVEPQHGGRGMCVVATWERWC